MHRHLPFRFRPHFHISFHELLNTNTPQPNILRHFPRQLRNPKLMPIDYLRPFQPFNSAIQAKALFSGPIGIQRRMIYTLLPPHMALLLDKSVLWPIFFRNDGLSTLGNYHDKVCRYGISRKATMRSLQANIGAAV